MQVIEAFENRHPGLVALDLLDKFDRLSGNVARGDVTLLAKASLATMVTVVKPTPSVPVRRKDDSETDSASGWVGF